MQPLRTGRPCGTKHNAICIPFHSRFQVEALPRRSFSEMEKKKEAERDLQGQLTATISEERQALLEHPLYVQLRTVEDLAEFMQQPVFEV